MKVLKKIRAAIENIDKSHKEMKAKKNEFSKEWDKWGTKRAVKRKIP